MEYTDENITKPISSYGNQTIKFLKNGAGKMAWQVKASVTKPDSLCLILKSAFKSCPLTSNVYYTHMQGHKHKREIMIKKINKMLKAGISGRMYSEFQVSRYLRTKIKQYNDSRQTADTQIR